MASQPVALLDRKGPVTLGINQLLQAQSCSASFIADSSFRQVSFAFAAVKITYLKAFT